MQIFNKNTDLYAIGHHVHRMTMRALGVLLALFTSTRAHADTLSSACPTCKTYGVAGLICDSSKAYSGYSSARAYEQPVYCIPIDNRGVPYAQIVDSDCVKKLQAWGMCKNTPVSNGYMLYNTGLSCTTASATQSYSGLSVYGRTLSPWESQTGYETYMGTIVGFTTSESDYSACCNISSGLTGAPCQLISGSINDCINTLMCGIFTSSCYSPCVEYGTANISGSLSSGSSSTCTQEFQAYFRTAQSTGFCHTTGAYSGHIFVEGLGAMLIAQACYGTNYISGYGNLIQAACGVVLEYCNGDSGYYHNGKAIYPWGEDGYGYEGADAYCLECPDETHAPWWSGIEYSMYSTGTGIESCYATPTPNPLSPVIDSTGTFTLSIAGDCQYQE